MDSFAYLIMFDVIIIKVINKVANGTNIIKSTIIDELLIKLYLLGLIIIIILN